MDNSNQRSRSTQGWESASKKDPCPKCMGTSWCAVNVGANVVNCRRNTSGFSKQDRNGNLYYVFPLHEDRKQQCMPAMTDADERHLIYSSLLDILELSATDRESLKARGLSDIQIEKARYRTLPVKGRSAIAKKLFDLHGKSNCLGTPGIVRKENSDGSEYFTIAATGIVIPSRTFGGGIRGLCIRREKEEPKYIWLSSKKSKGPSPEMITHVPLELDCKAEYVRLTEGVLKADVTLAISGFPTIGMPGIGMWKTVVPVLEKLGAKTVLFAPDADFRSNSQVAQNCIACVEGLLAAGYFVEFEHWEAA